ncbi:MAG: hypothetical protein M1546_09920, partial [Chloroflexi bacterium]|nr:hypothetical protein [Chloroflexota bacterium]
MSACAGAAGNAPATSQPTPTAAAPLQSTEAPATATMETLKATSTPERLSSPLATPATMTPAGSSAQSPATATAPEQITLPTGIKSMCAQVTEQEAVEVDKTGTDQPVVAYDAGTNTVTVRAGAPATLAGIQAALGQRPDVLRELRPGEWLLAANLRVDAGAVMRVAAPEVRWLKLRCVTCRAT